MNLIDWIELPDLGDHRGSLVVAEANKSIPFNIQRLYYIFGAQPDVPRGFHAHRQLQQIAFCIQGSCKMLMDSGKEKQEVVLCQPNLGLKIPPMKCMIFQKIVFYLCWQVSNMMKVIIFVHIQSFRL